MGGVRIVSSSMDGLLKSTTYFCNLETSRYLLTVNFVLGVSHSSSTTQQMAKVLCCATSVVMTLCRCLSGSRSLLKKFLDGHCRRDL